ncbi:MAG: ferredoxin family protein [Myxococcales bacterium]|nr:ferredoxin family protein [Myxococcales bacterium]
MAYIITQLCTDCVDMGCVEVCPVECIYQLADEPTPERPNMLYIHPTECINCGACEPECPWEAIYEDMEMPAALKSDIELNALTEERPSLFKVAEMQRDEHGRLIHKPAPGSDAIAANKAKWGLSG